MDDTVTINGEEYVRKTKPSGRVLVRCRLAGVHVGAKKHRDSDVLVLTDANRIWRWRGAKTLSEISQHGVDRTEWTRIATTVPEIELTASDVCEVVPVADGVDLSEVWHD